MTSPPPPHDHEQVTCPFCEETFSLRGFRSFRPDGRELEHAPYVKCPKCHFKFERSTMKPRPPKPAR